MNETNYKTKSACGFRFGRLIVIEFIRLDKCNKPIYRCICDCGKEKNIRLDSLQRGFTRSCGCLAIERTIKCNTGKMKKGLEPTIHPSLKDIYWAAGIYEGEGSCSAQTKGHTTSLATVVQKDTYILEKMRSLFGGSVSVRRSSGVSTWAVTGARGRGFLMTIYSLLSPRRKNQIKTVLSKDIRHG